MWTWQTKHTPEDVLTDRGIWRVVYQKKKKTESWRKCWRGVSGRMVDEYDLIHHMRTSQIIKYYIYV